jgi:hypothetical protein
VTCSGILEGGQNLTTIVVMTRGVSWNLCGVNDALKTRFERGAEFDNFRRGVSWRLRGACDVLGCALGQNLVGMPPNARPPGVVA